MSSSIILYIAFVFENAFSHKTYQESNNADHWVIHGKPVIKSTRITVELILRKLGQGATPSDLIKMYPHITEDDISAVHLYAADVLANEEVIDFAA